MNRRTFIGGAGAALASSFGARAQASLPLVGFLASVEPNFQIVAFRKGLAETGFVDARDVVVDYVWAEPASGKLPALAAELARRRVALIAAAGTPAALAAKAATTVVPIAFYIAADPVALGLVPSLSRPGGNLTGVTSMGVEIAPKRLELLHEIIPGARTFGHLVNPANPNSGRLVQDLQKAAEILGVRLLVFEAREAGDLESVFAGLAGAGVGGLVIAPDPFLSGANAQIAALSLRYRVPIVSPQREIMRDGGLMFYGGGINDQYYQLGVMSGRILKGEKPSSLPVFQSMKIELVINLVTARTLGVTIPLPLLGRADEVIE